MKLPFGERAYVGTKLEDYTLNKLHREGKHKAYVFESLLGITQSNAELLRNALVQAATNGDNALSKGDNGFGDVYVLDMPLQTEAASAIVRSVWIIRHGEDFPRLTTCYVL